MTFTVTFVSSIVPQCCPPLASSIRTKAGDRPRAGTSDDFRRRFERKEGGFNIGGPIYLPRFGEGGRSYCISGKDRTFFFFDWERRGQLIGDTRTVTNLPTAAERSWSVCRHHYSIRQRVCRSPAT